MSRVGSSSGRESVDLSSSPSKDDDESELDQQFSAYEEEDDAYEPGPGPAPGARGRRSTRTGGSHSRRVAQRASTSTVSGSRTTRSQTGKSGGGDAGKGKKRQSENGQTAAAEKRAMNANAQKNFRKRRSNYVDVLEHACGELEGLLRNMVKELRAQQAAAAEVTQKLMEQFSNPIFNVSEWIRQVVPGDDPNAPDTECTSFNSASAEVDSSSLPVGQSLGGVRVRYSSQSPRGLNQSLQNGDQDGTNPTESPALSDVYSTVAASACGDPGMMTRYGQPGLSKPAHHQHQHQHHRPNLFPSPSDPGNLAACPVTFADHSRFMTAPHDCDSGNPFDPRSPTEVERFMALQVSQFQLQHDQQRHQQKQQVQQQVQQHPQSDRRDVTMLDYFEDQPGAPPLSAASFTTSMIPDSLITPTINPFQLHLASESHGAYVDSSSSRFGYPGLAGATPAWDMSHQGNLQQHALGNFGSDSNQSGMSAPVITPQQVRPPIPRHLSDPPSVPTVQHIWRPLHARGTSNPTTGKRSSWGSSVGSGAVSDNGSAGDPPIGGSAVIEAETHEVELLILQLKELMGADSLDGGGSKGGGKADKPVYVLKIPTASSPIPAQGVQRPISPSPTTAANPFPHRPSSPSPLSKNVGEEPRLTLRSTDRRQKHEAAHRSSLYHIPLRSPTFPYPHAGGSSNSTMPRHIYASSHFEEADSVDFVPSSSSVAPSVAPTFLSEIAKTASLGYRKDNLVDRVARVSESLSQWQERMQVLQGLEQRDDYLAGDRARAKVEMSAAAASEIHSSYLKSRGSGGAESASSRISRRSVQLKQLPGTSSPTSLSFSTDGFPIPTLDPASTVSDRMKKRMRPHP